MSENSNQTIKCKVDDCKYYQKGDVCTASTIKVEPGKEMLLECADCITYSPVDNKGCDCGCK